MSVRDPVSKHKLDSNWGTTSQVDLQPPRVYVNTHAHIHTHTHTHIYMREHTHAHTCTHTVTHTLSHIHTHTHTGFTCPFTLLSQHFRQWLKQCRRSITVTEGESNTQSRVGRRSERNTGFWWHSNLSMVLLWSLESDNISFCKNRIMFQRAE